MLFVLLIAACKTEKRPLAKNTNDVFEPQAQVETQKEPTLSKDKQKEQDKWIKVNRNGFHFSNSKFIGKEYDDSLNLIDFIDVSELIPIEIVAITNKKLPKDKMDQKNNCAWANFVKINYEGKEKIVFGQNIIVPIRKHKTQKLSLWETKNYQTGVADEYGLTGCDESYYLLVVDQDGNAHAVRKNIEELYYARLVHSEVADDKIQLIKEENGVLSVNILRTLQEEAESYSMKIFQKDGTWWADLSEPKEADDERLTKEK